MMQKNLLQKRINNSVESVEERFMESVLIIAQKYPQYTIEFIRDEMEILVFLSIINILNKQSRKEKPQVKIK